MKLQLMRFAPGRRLLQNTINAVVRAIKVYVTSVPVDLIAANLKTNKLKKNKIEHIHALKAFGKGAPVDLEIT